MLAYRFDKQSTVRARLRLQRRAFGSSQATESDLDRFNQLFAVVQDDASKFDRIEFLPCLDGATGFLILETDDPTLVHQSLLTFVGSMRYRVHPVNDFDGLQAANAYAMRAQATASE